jgi:hypothetical protein
MKNIKFLPLLSLYILMMVSLTAQAQESFDPDVRFLEARRMILDGNRDEGRKIAFDILKKYPGYSDVLILVGRSYSWDGQYDSASF